MNAKNNAFIALFHIALKSFQMKKYLLFVVIIFLASTQSYSQVRCGFDDVLNSEFALDPNYKINVEEVNVLIQQEIQRQKMKGGLNDGFSLSSVDNTVYIPLVFHILHNGGALGSYDNPSDASVISTVDYLNKVYDGTWTGAGGSILGVGDINIKFVLATKDPDNNVTTGIERINASGVSGYSADGLYRKTSGADEATLKNLSRWDTYKYYNIWVVHEIDGCGGSPNPCSSWTGGFAYFPYEPVGVGSVSIALQRDRDGTVMLATGMQAGNLLLPHEIGHSLNLYHPFQGVDANNACPPTDPTQGDRCADTDPVTNPQGAGNQYPGYARDASPYTLPNPNPCAEDIPFNELTEKNFMNYTFTTRLFTSDQKDRMKASTISTIREGLSTSWANNRSGYPTTWVAPKPANVTPVTSSTGLNSYLAGIYRVELNDMIVNSLVTKEDGGYLDNTTKWYDLFSIDADSTYTINVNILNNGNNNQLGVYIDYNNDGVFNETTEKIFLNYNIPLSEGVGITLKKSITFTVPASSGIAVGSIVRMRVINDLSTIYSLPSVSGSSSSLTYGQAEDYAIYLGSNNSITFDANGGTGTMSDQTITYNTSANLTANTFTRTSYTFAGWATTSGGAVAYANSANYTMSAAANVTLYAQWTANDYTVTFNANSGTGTMAPQTIAFNASANLTPNAFTRTSYTFAGWATTSGGAVAYANSASYTMSSAANVTLYAQWTLNNYTVTFDANGDGGTGTMSTQTIAFNASDNLTANTFTRTGYIFAGWNTAANGSGTSYANSASYTMSSAANVTLYAQWTANDYTVTFDANVGTGTMSTQTIAFNASANLTSNAFTRTGYTFAGWATTSGGTVAYANSASYTMSSAANVTLYAQWTANDYTVTFDANGDGGTGTMTPQTIAFNASANLTANAFTRTSYTFAGWATTSGGAVAYANSANYTMSAAANVTLYAQWTANDYTVTFNANSGTGTMAPQTIAFNASANLTPNAFTRTAYTFAGWATTSGGAVAYANSANYTMSAAANVTLYAQWTANDYTVTFNANSGTGTMTPQTIAFNASANLTANAFTRTSYTFAGWATTSGGSVAYANSASYTMSAAANVTLYAQWTLTSLASVSNYRCGPGIVSLTASGCSGTYNWFIAGIGGSPIGISSVFTTPSINETTTYYVACNIDDLLSTRVPVLAIINVAIVHSNETQVSGNYSSSATITSIAAVSSPTNYKAGASILLEPGFKTSGGTVFKAEIGPCEN
jgi:uncharacterized repeat protein (TIGR02543 family)